MNVSIVMANFSPSGPGMEATGTLSRQSVITNGSCDCFDPLTRLPRDLYNRCLLQTASSEL